MSTRNFISLGIMTGTSLDGLDISIIKSDGINNLAFLDGISYSFNDEMRESLHSILGAKKRDSIIDLIESNYTNFIIKKMKQFLLNKRYSIDLIGFHGQTIFHKPNEGISWQIGDAKKISNFFKKKIIYDFRSNDIKNGGNGAPLTPIYHKLLKKKLNFDNVAFINLGGISNATIIINNQMKSFDCGPCCSISDEFVKSKINKNFDYNGKFALKGKVNKKIIREILKNNFFRVMSPKSLDRLDITNEIFLQLNIFDGLSTINSFIAESIFLSLNNCSNNINKIILLGGGRKNLDLVKKIKNKFISSLVLVSEEVGINGDLTEASAFAYLAIRSLKKNPISYPNTTGVKLPVTGGKFYN